MGFSQNYPLSKSAGVSSLSDQQHRYWRRVRAAENILVGEYNAAKVEFDCLKETSLSSLQVQASCNRYIDAIRRLREFLAAREIPPEVAKQLE
jgi:hypothetical protein